MTPKEKAMEMYEQLVTLKSKNGSYVLAIEEDWKVLARYIVSQLLLCPIEEKAFIYQTNQSIVYCTYSEYISKLLIEIENI
jgi:hypothetical protein